MRIDAEEIIVTLLIVVAVVGYLLFGAFWAEIFGLEGTAAYYAMVLLWPCIGFAIFLIGGVIFTCFAGLLTLIIGAAKS
jgi:hypothetical protein